MDKKSFREIYQSLSGEETPRQRFRREIAEVTDRAEQTVKQWLAGTQMPSPKAMSRISQHLGIEPEILFPNVKLENTTDDKLHSGNRP